MSLPSSPSPTKHTDSILNSQNGSINPSNNSSKQRVIGMQGPDLQAPTPIQMGSDSEDFSDSGMSDDDQKPKSSQKIEFKATKTEQAT